MPYSRAGKPIFAIIIEPNDPSVIEVPVPQRREIVFGMKSGKERSRKLKMPAGRLPKHID